MILPVPNLLPELNKVSAAAIEQIGNRLILLDPLASRQLDSFKEKVIHIEITDWAQHYYLHFPSRNLVVQNQSSRPASASIKGTSFAFLSAATADHSGDSIFRGELHFSGEINTAQKFQRFIESLQIDWQEPIAKMVGDEATTLISNGVSSITGFFKNLVLQTRQDIPEYIQHEAKLSPSSFELDSFASSVDTIRSQVDRLAARIERLRHD
ncbi:MAG: SCP2 sterol-binding domain-containing protein [Kangiellaceae bacterium]|nr:SCP2 sterol-binding domain-containing protein [Kangiellaceae bacterium]MCW8998633.1 SCP2 sterol-binding domain-containing protein [Kangiellaceae bacterium]